MAGGDLGDHPLRRRGHATAAPATARRDERATAEAFAEAVGDLALHREAGKVNPREGGRAVKVGVVARRERGEPTTAAPGDERALPAPAVRCVASAGEEAAGLGERGAAEAQRLELTDPTALSVLGDGAEWILPLTQQPFPGARRVLDLAQGAEYLADAAKAVFGPGTAGAKSQARQGRRRRRRDGEWGGTPWGGERTGPRPAGGEGAARGERLNYFAGQQERLG